MAQLSRTAGCAIRVEANEIFIELPEAMIAGLFAAGFKFYRWDGTDSTCIRLVTAWNTQESAVDAMIAAGFAELVQI